MWKEECMGCVGMYKEKQRYMYTLLYVCSIRNFPLLPFIINPKDKD